ncbi:VOC family protein [Paenibacillus albidus]|uniref:VOC family protein n=1 Tax=Paenibacillus albidus TaxID=2041023 RepID=UPI001BE94041|nr:VOC family protein [Paenibacillus albidus]MBT2289293.1 VOC family protein [Paenibacillus albidus]
METNPIQKVGQIGVPVKDMGRAVDFYKNKLGLSLLFQMERMAFFELGGQRLLLSLPEQAEFANAGSVLYFQVGDIQEVYADLVNKGVNFTDEPHSIAKMGQTETWMTFFRDSEGNVLALMSEVGVE